MFFRASCHRTLYPSLCMSRMNSFRSRAYRIHSSMRFIRRNFQLPPLAAMWYSALERDATFFFSFGWNTGRPNSLQIKSLRTRSSVSSGSLMWSFLPSSRLTLLMIKWEWICVRSVWVQIRTSRPWKYSASFSAAAWAAAGSTSSPAGKDWTMW